MNDSVHVSGNLAVDQNDPALQQIMTDLDSLYAITPPTHLRDQMDSVVQAQLIASHRIPRPSLTRGMRWQQIWRPQRLLALVTAIIVVVSGGIGYLRLTTPTPVSAQAILSRAAVAAHLTAGQTLHAIYDVTLSGDVAGKLAGATLNADVWIQAGPNGETRSAQTLSVSNTGGSTLLGRVIQDGQQTYLYDPSHNTIILPQSNEARGIPSWLLPNDVLNSASTTQSLQELAQQDPQSVHLLAPQTIDGQAVDAVEVDGWAGRPALRTTFYIDPQSYVVRGFDAINTSITYDAPSWQARLRSYTPVPAAAIPTSTFTLNAPATARIDLQQLAIATFASMCRETSSTSSTTMKDLLKSGQSPLAICKLTSPQQTATGLVAALIIPLKTTLDATVASGQITAQQEAASLAQEQAWLTTWVTTGQNGATALPTPGS